MPSEQKRLVVMITHGTDHELSSVGFTIANGGITAGLKVSVNDAGLIGALWVGPLDLSSVFQKAATRQ